MSQKVESQIDKKVFKGLNKGDSRSDSFESANEDSLRSLYIRLKDYGLNPVDWRITREASSGGGQYWLSHRREKEFRLFGRWTSGSHWSSLEWLDV